MTGLDEAWQIHTPGEHNSISFYSQDNDEMLRITQDAFYVRGKLVPQDAKEAETVYQALRSWLTWANLQRK